MPLCRILEHFDNADGWEKGDVVDITDPWLLIEEHKVALIQGDGAEEEVVDLDEEEEVSEAIPIDDIPGITTQLAGYLKKDGIETVDELIDYGVDNLDDIHGVGPKSIEFIRGYLS